MEQPAAEAEVRFFNRPPECSSVLWENTMGLLDYLLNLFRGNTLQCPSCGTQGAQRTPDGGIRCENPSCACFDASLGRRGPTRPAGTALRTEGAFIPARPVTIRYRNFAGQERTFLAEMDSVVRKGNHLVGRFAPTGTKMALSRDRIQNLAEVESVLPQRVAPGQPLPTPRERQVLGYHKNHGTSSPLFEKIRAKYPDW